MSQYFFYALTICTAMTDLNLGVQIIAAFVSPETGGLLVFFNLLRWSIQAIVFSIMLNQSKGEFTDGDGGASTAAAGALAIV